MFFIVEDVYCGMCFIIMVEFDIDISVVKYVFCVENIGSSVLNFNYLNVVSFLFFIMVSKIKIFEGCWFVEF